MKTKPKTKPKTPKTPKKKPAWHTVEITTVLLLRVPHAPPKLASGTREAVYAQLIAEGFSAQTLARMIADCVESFSWEEG